MVKRRPFKKAEEIRAECKPVGDDQDHGSARCEGVWVSPRKQRLLDIWVGERFLIPCILVTYLLQWSQMNSNLVFLIPIYFSKIYIYLLGLIRDDICDEYIVLNRLDL